MQVSLVNNTAISNTAKDDNAKLKTYYAYPVAQGTTRDLTGKIMLVLGATSDIARATIFELIEYGWSFYLTGRDLKALQLLAEDVAKRSGSVVAYAYFD